MVAIGAQGLRSEDDLKGGTRPKPGRYHVFIADVDESMEKYDKIVVDFEVLTGTVPGQQGLRIQEFFATTPKALIRLQRLALVTELLKPGEPERDVIFSDAVRKHLVIEVEENEYTNKDGKQVQGVRVSFLGMWSFNNKEVAEVPKDMEAYEMAQKAFANKFDAFDDATVSQPAPASKWATL